MTDLEKFDYIHSAIQEAQNGNDDMLEQALGLVEDMREKHINNVVLEIYNQGMTANELRASFIKGEDQCR